MKGLVYHSGEVWLSASSCWYMVETHSKGRVVGVSRANTIASSTVTVAVGSRVDGEDNGISASVLATLDDLLSLSVVGGQVQLSTLALIPLYRKT
jgi:uncharacterized phage protein gp47/JayE